MDSVGRKASEFRKDDRGLVGRERERGGYYVTAVFMCEILKKKII